MSIRRRPGRSCGSEGAMRARASWKCFSSRVVRARRAIEEAARGKADTSCAHVLPKDLGDWRPTVEFLLGPSAAARICREISVDRFLQIGRARHRRPSAARASARCSRKSGGRAAGRAFDAGHADRFAAATLEIETTKGRIAARAVIVTASTNVLASRQDPVRARPAQAPARCLQPAPARQLRPHRARACPAIRSACSATISCSRKPTARARPRCSPMFPAATLVLCRRGGLVRSRACRQGQRRNDGVRARLARQAVRRRRQEGGQAQPRDAVEQRSLRARRVIGGHRRRSRRRAGS